MKQIPDPDWKTNASDYSDKLWNYEGDNEFALWDEFERRRKEEGLKEIEAKEKINDFR